MPMKPKSSSPDPKPIAEARFVNAPTQPKKTVITPMKSVMALPSLI